MDQGSAILSERSLCRGDRSEDRAQSADAETGRKRLKQLDSDFMCLVVYLDKNTPFGGLAAIFEQEAPICAGP